MPIGGQGNLEFEHPHSTLKHKPPGSRPGGLAFIVFFLTAVAVSVAIALSRAPLSWIGAALIGLAAGGVAGILTLRAALRGEERQQTEQLREMRASREAETEQRVAEMKNAPERAEGKE